MISRTIATLFLIWIAAAPALAQEPRCADPTPKDSAWWHWTSMPNSDGSATMTAPEPPAQDSSFLPASIVGPYLLRMVHTTGRDAGSGFSADVRITGGVGIAAIRGRWPRYLSFASASVDSARQTIEVQVDSVTHQVSLVIGNPGLRTTDAGVFLEVFTITETLLVGRWVDGGLLVFDGPGGSHPQGWFCLAKATS